MPFENEIMSCVCIWITREKFESPKIFKLVAEKCWTDSGNPN